MLSLFQSVRVGVDLEDSKYGLGFTLAEVLIALALLGLIAAFTLPKLLVNSNNAQKKAVAKEAAAMMSEAYTRFRLEHTPDGGTDMTDILPYLNNTLGRDTTSVYRTHLTPTIGLSSCASASTYCFRTHTGALVIMGNGIHTCFWCNSTNTDGFPGPVPQTSAIFFQVDPTNSQGRDEVALFFLFFNGRLTSAGTTSLAIGYVNNIQWDLGSLGNPMPADPPWFSW